MGVLLLLAAALQRAWAAEPAIERRLALCVANPRAISADLRQQWESELRRILDVSDYRLVLENCRDESLQIRFLTFSAEEPNALGGAQTAKKRVQPRMEIYMTPLAELIGTRLSGPLGKAMARVTAHELRHFLTQEIDHGSSFAGTYSAGLLLAAKPSHFRLR